ncbi:MATE family efflux transporter [bacterium]|nr:MATE family efflux transporter [bacterium]
MSDSPRKLIVRGDLRKALLSLALPMMFGNLAQNLFNLTDMYFVGKLGSLAIASVGMAGVLIMGTMVLIIGLATATRAMVSRYIGASDFENAHRAVVGSILFGIFFSIIIAAGGATLGKFVLSLIGAKGELLQKSFGYLLIMMLGGFSMVFLFIVNATLQGAGDAKTSMKITFTAVILNIILDPLFIFGIGPFPQWGVNGAAFATVLARFLGASIGILILARGVKAFKLHIKNFRTDMSIMKKFFHIGIPGGGQVLVNNFMGFIMMRLAAGFGVAVTAAYTIGIRLNMLALLPGFALGGGSATIVGQNLGAGNKDRAKKGALTAVKFYEMYIIPIGIIYYLLAPKIVSLFTGDAETIMLATEYLRTISLIYPIFAVGTVLMRAVNGAGKTIPSFIAMFSALYLFQLPVALYLTRQIGPHGIWWAIATGMAGQGILIIPYFFSMKWAQTGKFK